MYVIIDVREPYEFQNDHATNAINIPLSKIVEEHQNYNLDKYDKIYVHCRTGNRSEHAKALLESLGYKNIINIKTVSAAKEVSDE